MRSSEPAFLPAFIWISAVQAPSIAAPDAKPTAISNVTTIRSRITSFLSHRASQVFLRQHHPPALPVPEETFCLRKTAFGTSKTGEFHLPRIPLLRLLGSVRITSGPPLRFDIRDIDEIPGRKHHGIFGDFVEIERRFPAAAEPCVEDQHRDGPVIAVLVNGPLNENDVSLLTVEQAAEIVVMGVVDNRAAVILPGKSSASLEDAARFFGFGTAHRGALGRVRAFAESLTAIQVQENHLVTEVG